MKIIFASDHAGYELKQQLISIFSQSDFLIEDLGTDTSHKSSDYSDFSRSLAESIFNEYPADALGIGICGTGIGMNMALNKYPFIRAALCHTPFEAEAAKKHNNANVLNFGGRTVSVDQAELCIKAYLDASFEGGHHNRRIEKFYKAYIPKDKDIYQLIGQEVQRQRTTIDLIASENIVDEEVLYAQGSPLTNKYAEGYPNHRYYGGCEIVDQIESIAMDRLKKIFSCEYANVQPHSGAIANMVALFSLAHSGDTIMGLDLEDGGHLTHGSTVNFSGKWFHSVSYKLNPKTHLLDYESILDLAITHKPKVIIAGYSAYPRFIDFSKFKEICNKVSSFLLVDMAHISGLIAAGEFPNPFPFADIVTSTTHKTLRGSRGGIILTNHLNLAKSINKAVFPMIQGGPLMNEIAGKAVAFYKVLQPEFRSYIKRIKENIQAMVDVFHERNVTLITGGSDTHLILINLVSTGITGKDLEYALNSVDIIVNKNMIPNDPNPPKTTSGIRIGSPSIASRNIDSHQSRIIAHYIADTIDSLKVNKFDEISKKIHRGVKDICVQNPVYQGYI